MVSNYPSTAGVVDVVKCLNTTFSFLPKRHIIMVNDTSCLPKNSLDKQHRPRSGVFPVCYSDKHFVNSSPETILFENRKRKVFEFVELLPYKQYRCRSDFPDRHFVNFSPYLETDGEKHS